jgi:hypothetical protein
MSNLTYKPRGQAQAAKRKPPSASRQVPPPRERLEAQRSGAEVLGWFSIKSAVVAWSRFQTKITCVRRTTAAHFA